MISLNGENKGGQLKQSVLTMETMPKAASVQDTLILKCQYNRNNSLAVPYNHILAYNNCFVKLPHRC